MKGVARGRVKRVMARVTSLTTSLRVQFTILVTALFTGLAATIIGVASYMDVQEAEILALEKASNVADTIARLAVFHLRDQSLAIFETELEKLQAHKPAIAIQVRDYRTNLLIDGDPTTPKTTGVVTALSKSRRVGETHKNLLALSSSVIKLSIPVISDDKTIGAVHVFHTHSGWSRFIGPITIRNAAIAAFILILGVPITLLFGRRILDPIQKLTQTAYRVSEGDLEAPFPVTRNDEIGILARAYQDMVGTIHGNMERINQLAYMDPVTGLQNRTRFRERVGSVLEDDSGMNGAILFIDLDRFKKVNDTFGHDVGDALLVTIAERLKTVVQEITTIVGAVSAAKQTALITDDTPNTAQIARLGGDEFALLIPGHCSTAQPTEFAERIIAELTEPVDVEGNSVIVGASVGIAVYPDDGTDTSSLLKNADIAMYEAKSKGGNKFCFFDHRLDRQIKRRAAIESELRRAVVNNELTVFYQPKVDCRTWKTIGVEALVRWIHPVRGLVGPDEFIGIAEESGLINQIGELLLKEVCQQAIRWAISIRPLEVSVNISMAQLHRPDFADRTLKIIEESGVPHEILEFEVTESMAMTEADLIEKMITPLRAQGIRFAIDDFGTGYSSLAQLTKLPFDVFKIDRSFIDGVMKDHNSRVIVETILAMAQSLNYKTVAEGVETWEQAEFLTKNGCTLAQGYYFAKPMPAHKFEAWLAENEEPTVRQLIDKAEGF